jgi:hypothetical protein
MAVRKKGKKLSSVVPASALKEWGLNRPEIQNLSVEDLNEIGMMFSELNARQRGKKGRGGAGACTTGACTTGVCTTGVCTCG